VSVSSGLWDWLSMLEAHSNLMWLPTDTKVPLLLSLRMTPRATVTAPPVTRATCQVRASSPDSEAVAATPHCNSDHHVSYPSRAPKFVGNTPFIQNVHVRAVLEAIYIAGAPPPMVSRNGVSGAMCVSWHSREQCFENYARCADHGLLTEAETTEFHTWCALAYA
jgi:hypothetical protein